MNAPKLSPDRLYFGDNGRLFCGQLKCAGSSAHFTGRDLSGHKVEPVDAHAIRTFMAEGLGAPKCEGCGREATLVTR